MNKALTKQAKNNQKKQLLEAIDLSKSYPGVKALDKVSISVRSKEVLGLVGENGAGKTTLLKILSGAVRPDAGSIRLSGEQVAFRSVLEAADHGLAMVSQDQSILPNLTVAENVCLGSEDIVTPGPFYRWTKVREWTVRWLEAVNSKVRPEVKAGTLPFQDRQLVEFAKALSVRQRASSEGILLLDEPTTVLDQEQIDSLFELISNLKSETAIVFVSHRLEEVLEISDRIYVMRDGKIVGERIAADCSPDELFHLMVGKAKIAPDSMADRITEMQTEDAPIVLELRNVSGAEFDNVDLQIRQGEIVGIAGVRGSGKEALCRSIFGAVPIVNGDIRVLGSRVNLSSPVQAVDAGIGYVPADRRIEGAAASLSLKSNISLSHLDHFSKFGVVDGSEEASTAADWADRLKIKAPSLKTRMGTLSGGNQQKALLARWLISGDVKVLLLDHPTRGLDIAAKEEVLGIIQELAEEGLGIILLADSLEELLALSNRIIVMKDGSIVREFYLGKESPSTVDIVSEMV